MTHDVNTHVHLGELEDIVARPGEDPQDLIACHPRHWWTTVRWSMMSIMSTNCVAVSSVHTARRESSLENLWPSHSRHPTMSWLTLLWTTLPTNTPGNKSPTAPNLWTQSARTKGRWSTPAHNSHGSHTICTLQGLSQLHPTAPSWQSKLPHMWFPLFKMQQDGTLGTQNAMVASHSNQGTHLHLGHSRGSPDAHLGATTTAEGGATRQTP